jgi:branched-chain amino acid transport system permease protein
MAEFLQFLISGLTVGAVYALVALGFTLIYNASGVVNFAQGEFVMLGGMVTVFASAAGVPLFLAALIAVVAAIAIGLLLHRLAIEPARGASAVTLIIITIGASILLRGLAAIIFDKQFHKLPAFTGDAPIDILGAAVQPQSFWVLGGAAVVVVALYVFLERTLLGKAVLATAANRLAARLVGINTTTIMALAFGGSAAIGAIAGILVTPITLTNYDVGTLLALKGFAAAMLGGMGNPVGAVVGGLLLGLLEAFGAGYLSSTYKDAFAFLVILKIGRAHV